MLEGRQLVLLNIDEVIRIIRAADEPKPALIERFELSERQADDILEIRLRQLARLEAIKIEQELKELRERERQARRDPEQPGDAEAPVIKEIEADAKAFGDDAPHADPGREARRRREQRGRRAGHGGREPEGLGARAEGPRGRSGELAFKAGDGLYGTFACRSVETLLVFGSNGRVYSTPVAQLPGGRGDGQPITTLIDLEPRHAACALFRRPAAAPLLLAATGGFGLLARVGDLTSRSARRQGIPQPGGGREAAAPSLADGHDQVACVSLGGPLLVFALAELKLQSNGGRGLTLIDLDAEGRARQRRGIQRRVAAARQRPRRQAEGRAC